MSDGVDSGETFRLGSYRKNAILEVALSWYPEYINCECVSRLPLSAQIYRGHHCAKSYALEYWNCAYGVNIVCTAYKKIEETDEERRFWMAFPQMEGKCLGVIEVGLRDLMPKLSHPQPHWPTTIRTTACLGWIPRHLSNQISAPHPPCSKDYVPCGSSSRQEQQSLVEHVRNVMAHAHKPHLVFQPNGRVHLNRRGGQFSRLLAVEQCGSADRPWIDHVPTCSARLLATHSIRIFPLNFPSRASPCAITFRTA